MQPSTIAANLAAQLPSWEDRAAVCRAAGLGDVQLTGDARSAWAGVVDEAVERGKIDALLTAAARYRPNNRVLQGMAGLPAPSGRGSAFGLWAALAALAVVAGLARWGLGGGEEAPGGATVADALVAPIAEDAAPAAAESAAAPAVAPTIGSAAATTIEPAAEPVAEAHAPVVAAPPPAEASGAAAPTPAEVAPSAPPVIPVPAAAAHTPAASGRASPCPRAGFAWVAAGAAPAVGGVWRVPGSIYVRADYPRADNGWSSRAPVVCSLPAGATVRVVNPPLTIAGGAVWVPVRPDAIGMP